LEDNGFTEFYGVQGAIRGSKCISVYVKKTHRDEFEKLNGKSDRYHSYYMSKMWEFDDAIQYNINCRRV
jgi:hypothetical protein